MGDAERKAHAALATTANQLSEGGPHLADAFGEISRVIAAVHDQMFVRGVSVDEIVRRIRGE